MAELSLDVKNLLSYIKNSAEAHPELNARALLARATYVYAGEGFDQVRRAIHVELDSVPRSAL